VCGPILNSISSRGKASNSIAVQDGVVLALIAAVCCALFGFVYNKVATDPNSTTGILLVCLFLVWFEGMDDEPSRD